MTIQKALDSNKVKNVLDILDTLSGMELLFAIAQIEIFIKQKQKLKSNKALLLGAIIKTKKERLKL